MTAKTAKELIEILSKLPDDTPVYTIGTCECCTYFDPVTDK